MLELFVFKTNKDCLVGNLLRLLNQNIKNKLDA